MLVGCKMCHKAMNVVSANRKYCGKCRIISRRQRQNAWTANHRKLRPIRTPTKTISIPPLVSDRFKGYRKRHGITSTDCMLSILADMDHLKILANKIEKVPESVRIYT